MNRIFLVATFCFLFVSAASAQGMGKDRTPEEAEVAVDCNARGSITDALATPAVKLTIEISGICAEDVEILRNDVTLRGTDPLTDGIRPAPEGLKRQALTLFGVNNIIIENLNLAGANNGIGINASFGVFVINCLIEDNSFAGVIAGTASTARVLDTVIRNIGANPNRGIWATQGSNVSCIRCTIENHQTGIRLTNGSSMLLDDSTVLGTRRGVDARGGSRFDSVLFPSTGPSTIEGVSQFAIRLFDSASANLGNDNINGQIRLFRNSVATLAGSSQSNPSFFNSIDSGSSLVARDSASLDGDFFISEFSNVTLPLGSSVSGGLSCSLGADAFCDNPSTATASSNCGQCLNP